jgi:hypothetical protein
LPLRDHFVSDQIVAAFPQLEVADVHQALDYAAAAVRERDLPLRQIPRRRCLTPLVAELLAVAGHDAVQVVEVGFGGHVDVEVMARGVADDRVLGLGGY